MFEGRDRNFQGVQMLGVMNSLKTRNPIVETSIALVLPFIVNTVLSRILVHDRTNPDSYWSTLGRTLGLWKEYTRTISYRASPHGSQNGGGSSGDSSDPLEDEHNYFLIKAIKLYMYHFCNQDFDDADLELTDVSNLVVRDDDDLMIPAMALLAMGDWTTPSTPRKNSASAATLLSGCKIIKKPVHWRWHEVGVFDGRKVYVCIRETWHEAAAAAGSRLGDYRSGGIGADNCSRLIELRLKSDRKASVDAFVDKAYSWFNGQLKELEKNERFYFDLQGFEGIRNTRLSPLFSQLKLGDEKTFDSLFSQQCRSIIKMLDQFTEKSGKYAVKGYPHKLGLLLHGPPGTGK